LEEATRRGFFNNRESRKAEGEETSVKKNPVNKINKKGEKLLNRRTPCRGSGTCHGKGEGWGETRRVLREKTGKRSPLEGRDEAVRKKKGNWGKVSRKKSEKLTQGGYNLRILSGDTGNSQRRHRGWARK